MSGKRGGGALNERVTFESPVSASDEYGGTVDGFVAEMTVSAKYFWQRGGEDVIAARLEGRSVLVARIRASSDARRISPDWRMVDARTAAVYNIRSILPTDDRAYLDLACEGGVAT